MKPLQNVEPPFVEQGYTSRLSQVILIGATAGLGAYPVFQKLKLAKQEALLQIDRELHLSSRVAGGHRQEAKAGGF